MGNRAAIVFSNVEFTEFSPCVYLHWNGGPESVYLFLDELERRGVRADQHYECARFIQIVGEFFDKEKRSGLSLGVSNGPRTLKNAASMDSGDNGVYVIARRHGYAPIVRRFHRGQELGEDAVKNEHDSARKHAYSVDGGFRAAWGDKPLEG